MSYPFSNHLTETVICGSSAWRFRGIYYQNSSFLGICFSWNSA